MPDARYRRKRRFVTETLQDAKMRVLLVLEDRNLYPYEQRELIANIKRDFLRSHSARVTAELEDFIKTEFNKREGASQSVRR